MKVSPGVTNLARVAQRQSSTFVKRRKGFDSLHGLHSTLDEAPIA